MGTWWKRLPRLNLLRRLLPHRRLSQPRHPNLLPFLSQNLSRRLHRGLNLHPPPNQPHRLNPPRRPNPHRQRSQRRNCSLSLNHRRSLRLLRRLCALRLNRQPHLRRNRNQRLRPFLKRRQLNRPPLPQRQSLSQLPNLRLRQNKALPPG